MEEDKIKSKRIINKRNLLIFLVLFVISYCLLHYTYKEIIVRSFNDIFKQIRNENYTNIHHGLSEIKLWQFFEPFILSITLSLICVYTKIFKRNCFKESIIALLIFIAALFLFVFLNNLYTHQREKSNEIAYKKLIVGKWHYTNRVVGNVIIVFSNDNTGYRFTDSVKNAEKFEYTIKRNLLSLALEYKGDFYWIDSLTTKTLILRRVKFKDHPYGSKFTRGSS